MSRKTARISPMQSRGRAGVLVQFPFDEHVLAQLKAYVPRAERWYNEHRKGWWVAEKHVEIVTHLLRETYPIDFVGVDGRTVKVTSTGERLYQEDLLK